MKGTLRFWTSEAVYWIYPSSKLLYQKPLTPLWVGSLVPNATS